eukprot:UN05591
MFIGSSRMAITNTGSSYFISFSHKYRCSDFDEKCRIHRKLIRIARYDALNDIRTSAIALLQRLDSYPPKY